MKLPYASILVLASLGIASGHEKEEASSSMLRAHGSSRNLPASSNASPPPRTLDTYPQWREEVGYWIGDLSFYQGDGTPNQSPSFNYPYDSYKGFITGDIKDLSYRQRNVFLYPPQTVEACQVNDSVTGAGECEVNGNSRIFSADQSATLQDRNGSVSGILETPFATIQTTTTLVGDDNALLYQVFVGDDLFQSQLTTLTPDAADGPRRTRTAQSFRGGVPSNASFYRERRVTKEEFYTELAATLEAYNILDSDACTTDGFGGQPTGYTGGFEDCKTHLEQCFNL